MTNEKGSVAKGKSPPARMWLAWFVCAVGGVAVLVGVLAALWRYQVWADKDASQGMCTTRIKTLCLALRNYSEEYGAFPPAYLASDDGTPMHSWRVLILPYMEHEEFYRRYDFNQPWNSPANLELARSHPDVGQEFQCAADSGGRKGWTSYVAIVGPDTLWPGSESVSREESPSPSSILLIETTESGIHWMEPRDLDRDEAIRALSSPGPHRGWRHVAFGDAFTRGSFYTSDRGAGSLTFAIPPEDLISEWATRQTGDRGQNSNSD